MQVGIDTSPIMAPAGQLLTSIRFQTYTLDVPNSGMSGCSGDLDMANAVVYVEAAFSPLEGNNETGETRAPELSPMGALSGSIDLWVDPLGHLSSALSLPTD